MQMLTRLLDRVRDRLGPGPKARKQIKSAETALQKERDDKRRQIKAAQQEERERINHIIDKQVEFHTEHGGPGEPRYAVHIEIPPSIVAYGSLDSYSQDVIARQIATRIEMELRRAHFVIPPKQRRWDDEVRLMP